MWIGRCAFAGIFWMGIPTQIHVGPLELFAPHVAKLLLMRTKTESLKKKNSRSWHETVLPNLRALRP